MSPFVPYLGGEGPTVTSIGIISGKLGSVQPTLKIRCVCVCACVRAGACVIMGYEVGGRGVWCISTK